MGITKNKQSNDKIIKMAECAFANKKVQEIKELTEGMCNAAYLVTFEDGLKSVLKIAASDRSGFMTNENNLMAAEVVAMKIVKEKSDIKVAQVFHYDTSKTLCDGDYFFMEALEGKSWSSVNETIEHELLEGVNAKLRFDVGVIQEKLSHITAEKFGLLGDATHRFDSLFDFIYYLISNVLDDAKEREVTVGISKDKMLAALIKDKANFAGVKKASLVHWDMWEGNILIQDNQITGIIDWERAMWGEPFMDDRFRSHSRNEDFLRGFGLDTLSEQEMRRIFWYDILLYLTMMIEVTYREYEDDGQYHWARKMFNTIWEELNR